MFQAASAVISARLLSFFFLLPGLSILRPSSRLFAFFLRDGRTDLSVTHQLLDRLVDRRIIDFACDRFGALRAM
jgi:hypothetical protein